MASFDLEAHYRQANGRLEALILESPVQPAKVGGPQLVAHTRQLLDRLGAPDRSYRCVLVGGTSGKGTVAALLAAYLRAAGYRVGLHTSPYLQVATEKIQIDGLYIDALEYAALAEWALPHLQEWQARPGARRGPGAIALAMAAEAMRRHAVEVGIFEVGSGGRFDPVNALEAAAVAITGVGLDHVALLGPTLQEIAWHKAGLIKSAAPVVTGASRAVLPAIAREAQAHGAPLQVVPAENASLAAALFRVLVGMDVPAEFPTARLPGRLEWMPGAEKVFLDAAHNPQKLAYLRRHWTGDKAVVLFGALAGKSVRPMLKILSRLAHTLVLTPIAVPGRVTCALDTLVAESDGLFSRVRVAPSPEAALQEALESRRGDEPILVTGSLYLVGQLRNYWYPVLKILQARQSWPGADT